MPEPTLAGADQWRDRVDARVVAALRPFARLIAAVHPVRIDGLEHLPEGPALLVGNHGLLGYETLVFFATILEKTGRMPLGLADRWFFKVPVLRDILVGAGGMLGCTTRVARSDAATGSSPIPAARGRCSSPTIARSIVCSGTAASASHGSRPS